MDVVHGDVDWSSRERGTVLSSSDDEVDIVGEGDIDDVRECPHVGTPLPSAHEDPIVECGGLSRLEWVDLEVVLLNESGIPVAEGICRNTHPNDCVDQNPLGDDDVGVVILEALVHSEVHPTQRFSLRRWAIRNVMHDGVSLRDHERRYL